MSASCLGEEDRDHPRVGCREEDWHSVSWARVPVGCQEWGAATEYRRLTSPHVSPGSQALVAELHRRALVEYVRPLLRGRLRCRSARTRSRVAGRLREDAAQLQRLFRRLVSVAVGAGGGSKTTDPIARTWVTQLSVHSNR